MSATIDHFMYAVPSLDEGIAWANDLFGVEPAYGGEHVGLGTRNALLSLGSTYLEIIAPDPAQSLNGNLGERFAALSSGGLVTWAVRGQLAEIAGTLNDHGIDTRGPNRTQRQTADNELLVWELLFPAGSPYGPRMPFFIDWLDCPHPATTNPVGGEFTELKVAVAEESAFAALLSTLGVVASVVRGDPGLGVVIQTPTGAVELESTAETSALRMH